MAPAHAGEVTAGCVLVADAGVEAARRVINTTTDAGAGTAGDIVIVMSRKKKNLENLDQYDYVDEDFIDAVSPDYIQAIGDFMLAFSSLEHDVNVYIADKVSDRTHIPGYQIVELLSMRNKIGLFSRMCLLELTYINPERRNEFQRLIKELESINTFRNKVVHANWMSLAKDNTVRTRIVIDEEEGYVQFERTKMPAKLGYIRKLKK